VLKKIHKCPKKCRNKSSKKNQMKKTSNGRNSHTEFKSGANKNKAPKVMEEWSW
jgi:hypothetical protein